MRKVHPLAKKRAALLTAGWMICFAIIFKILGSFLLVLEPLSNGNWAEGKASVHQSSSGPAIPSQAPVEPTFPDELEAKDECDDENSKLLTIPHSYGFNILHARKLLFLNLRISRENRASVGLFILHHSWKSFIC